MGSLKYLTWNEYFSFVGFLLFVEVFSCLRQIIKSVYVVLVVYVRVGVILMDMW